jgi:hypothetical protein
VGRHKGIFRLILYASAAGVVLGLAGNAHALPRVVPYINVTLTPLTLDLGSVPEPGPYDSASELKVHVAANCAHGGVVASVTPLTRTGGGGSIAPERVFVRIPATGVYVAMTSPVSITGAMMPGVFDVVLKFRVVTNLGDIPGQYVGTLTITCAGPP